MIFVHSSYRHSSVFVLRAAAPLPTLLRVTRTDKRRARGWLEARGVAHAVVCLVLPVCLVVVVVVL